MPIVRPRAVNAVRVVMAVILGVSLLACNPTRNVQEATSGEIVVEGIATVRGHVPFTGMLLVTNDRNSYVLTMHDEAALLEMEKVAPGRFRVSGVPYKDLWQGSHRAHLRVVTWEKID